MRTLVHLSDIHFGSIDPRTTAPVIRAVRDAAPDLVVVSGDLTQRATASQFSEAQRFLAQLPFPRLIVPGNHDIPLFNLIARFLRPLHNYRLYIDQNTEPFYEDGEIAVVGINTARSLAFKNGRINFRQITRVREKFCRIEKKLFKILVTHHPLNLPRDWPVRKAAGRARIAMESLASCGADLLLAGHYHFSHTGSAIAGYPIPGFNALFVHGGTATSSRVRGEPNVFNIIHIEPPLVTIDRQAWHPEADRFASSGRFRFELTADGWIEHG
jgi:3',5'-cyclic AMP phosphodiesterase CpdA